MKAFIIYNSANPRSVDNANNCLNSFVPFKSWDVELFDGYTPNNLPTLNERYQLKDTRARYKPTHEYFENKKACFFSHFHLWNMCVEMNRIIAVVEHDAVCVGEIKHELPDVGVVQLTSETVFKAFGRYVADRQTFELLPNGIHSVRNFSPHKESSPTSNWGYTIAGNVGYTITPSAAKILIADCVVNGWQQNDLLMNDNLIPVFHLKPSPLAYVRQRELQSSSKGLYK